MLPTTTLFLVIPAAFAQITTSPKRGLAYIQDTDAKDIEYFTSGDLNWYYNWHFQPTPELENSNLQYVPMLWGADDTQSFYSSVKSMVDNGRNISHVLGFNEPDGCGKVEGGSCVDAETAAALWIREVEPLKELGIELGAPAVTGSDTGFTWLQQWFTACDGRCHPDFIPIHWYGNFEGLASHVGRVNATYQNMTMWATEFGFPDQSLQATQDFFNQTVGFFDRLEYMTHYSLFGAFRSSKSNIGANGAMLTQKGELTDIGAWYLGHGATGHKPKGSAPRAAQFGGSSLLVLAAAFYCLG